MTRRAPITLVELCAGSAAVSLRWLSAKAKPPIAYQGSKRAYADSILDALGLRPGGFQAGDRIVLVELGPWADAYALWRTREGREHTIARLREWATDDPRALWARLADAPPPDDAADRVAVWTVLQSWAFGGKVVEVVRGRWNARAAGFNRGSAYGGEATENHGVRYARAANVIGALIADLPDLAAVDVVKGDVRHALPMRSSRVIFDPNYDGTTGYVHSLSREDVIAVANRWRDAGAFVAVCEASPVPLDGWHPIGIDGCGVLRTWSAQQSEYLTLSAPPMHAQQVLAL